MVRLGLLRGPGIPYLGTFCETNVRLYSVDGQGRRAVVFLSLEAERLVPVLTAQACCGCRTSGRGCGWNATATCCANQPRRWPGRAARRTP